MRRLLALGTLSIALVVALAPTASGGGAFVSVTPTEGGPGTPLHIEGNCGVAQSGIDVFVGFEINNNSVTLATTSTNGAGAFSADAPAPQIAPPIIDPGAGEIVALCDARETVRVTTPFTLLDDALGQEPPPDPGAVVEPAPATPVTARPSFTG